MHYICFTKFGMWNLVWKRAWTNCETNVKIIVKMRVTKITVHNHCKYAAKMYDMCFTISTRFQMFVTLCSRTFSHKFSHQFSHPQIWWKNIMHFVTYLLWLWTVCLFTFSPFSHTIPEICFGVGVIQWDVYDSEIYILKVEKWKTNPQQRLCRARRSDISWCKIPANSGQPRHQNRWIP